VSITVENLLAFTLYRSRLSEAEMCRRKSYLSAQTKFSPFVGTSCTTLNSWVISAISILIMTIVLLSEVIRARYLSS
jgi:hypothetical protein